MKALWIVMRKELIDAFRDRRMVLMAFLVMPLAVPSLLAGMSAVGIRKQLQKLEATLELPVIGAERAPNLMAWLGSHNIRDRRGAGGPGRRGAAAGTRGDSPHLAGLRRATGAPASRRVSS